MHLEGRTEADLRARYDGRLLRVRDLRAATARSAAAVVRSVAVDEPQSGAGYFLAAFGWARALGDDLATLRALSAVASTLAVLLVHRLARALGGSADVALAAAALVALSPLQLRYAQEARPYALWAALLVAAALALIRARTRGTVPAALAWAAALAAALWVQPLTLLALPAFAALGLGAGSRSPAAATSARLGVATVAALASWLVWAAVCLHGRVAIVNRTAWTSAPTGFLALVHGWIGAATAIFFRPWGEGGLLPAGMPWSAAVGTFWTSGIAAVVVVALGLRAVGTDADAPGRRFVRVLTLAPWAVLAATDVAFGGRRSTVTRYLVPAWIGAALATACLTATSRRGAAALVLLLTLATATAVRTRFVDVWWDTDPPRLRTIAAAARAIAATDGAVVVTDAEPVPLYELVHRLPESTLLRLGAGAPRAVDDWDRVLLYDPSERLRAATLAAVGPSRTLVGTPGLPLWRVGPAASS